MYAFSLGQVIEETFNKEFRRADKAMIVTFSIDVDYKKEEGIRMVSLLLYAPNNYVGVFAKEFWEVRDINKNVNRNGNYEYAKGNTGWKMLSCHDCCWREDGVKRFLNVNEDRISIIQTGAYGWYNVNPVGKEFKEELKTLMRREGDYQYNGVNDVFHF